MIISIRRLVLWETCIYFLLLMSYKLRFCHIISYRAARRACLLTLARNATTSVPAFSSSMSYPGASPSLYSI